MTTFQEQAAAARAEAERLAEELDELESDIADYFGPYAGRRTDDDTEALKRLIAEKRALQAKLDAANKRAFDCENPNLSWAN